MRKKHRKHVSKSVFWCFFECFVALPMAAMMAVGVASTRAHGQKTTRIVTARMISPVISHVSAAAHRIAHCFIHRQGLTGHHRLTDVIFHQSENRPRSCHSNYVISLPQQMLRNHFAAPPAPSSRYLRRHRWAYADLLWERVRWYPPWGRPGCRNA